MLERLWLEFLIALAGMADMMPRSRFACSILPVMIVSMFMSGTLHANPLRKVVGVMNSSTFRASVSIRSGSSRFSGTLSCSAGKMNFRLSDGRIIASNGRKIFAFDPSTRTMGRQDATGGGGLGWILSYNARITGNRAVLTPTSPNQRYEEVRLSWDDGYFLRSISMKGKGGDVISIRLSNIKRVASFPVSIFSYKPPPGSRTVDNPLNQRN